MTRGNSVRILIITAAAAALCAGAAWASGGGSMGGGGSMPSTSAPQYNPVEEFKKGVESLKGQQYKDAITHFNRVIEASPHHSGAWTLLGLAKEGAGDAKGARVAYEKAVRYDAENTSARQLLAVSEAKSGDTAKAQADLAELQKRQTACGDSCPKADELKAAVAAVQAALGGGGAATDTPKASLLFNSPAGGDRAYVEAVALINAGRYEDALQSLHRSELAFGPHPDILTYEGYANRKLRRYDQAEAYYTEALAVDPTHVGATEYYGELKVERGDIAGAKKLLARLDAICSFGCSEQEELRGWIEKAPSSQHGS